MKQGSMIVATGLALSMMLNAPAVQAGGTIKIDEHTWVSAGAGLRTLIESREDAAPSGKDRSNEFILQSVRLYFNGQIHENVKMTFNTEFTDDGGDDDSDIRVLDVIAQFEFSDLVNIWMGRFLPPSDRSNYSGPYFLGAFNFPGVVQQYPSIFAGRDDGVTFWGQTGGGQFKYKFGAFQGSDGDLGGNTPNDDDNLLYAGSVTFNAWDPEPGYYNASTYYGSKDILALGFAFMVQDDATGVRNNSGDFTGWNLDFLMEKKMGRAGVITLEAAYYDYDLDNRVFNAGLVRENGNGPTQGDGYFILASYLLPHKIGIGHFQPQIRFQDFDADNNGADTDQWEIGLNYIIDGHNARLHLVYGETDTDGQQEVDFLQFGVQLQM